MADFYQEGAAIDYTPVADITAGDVIVQGELVGVAKRDIAIGEKGALHVEGVFDFPKDGGVEAFAIGDLIYWDVADGFATSDADGGTNKLIGKVSEAALIGDTSVKARLSQ